MADTFTAHYNFTKPQVGGDSNTWGALLNTDLDGIDTAIFNAQTQANAGVTNAAAALARANTVAVFGMVMLWAGSIAGIPARWHLCDGTAGTPDLRDRFIVCAGASYGVGAGGGVAVYSLTQAQMPSHTHGVADPGHAHAVFDPQHVHGLGDPGHAHGVSDPGHTHQSLGSGFLTLGGNQSVNNSFQGPNNSQIINGTTNNSSNIGIAVAGTGMFMGFAATGIGIFGSGTGIFLGSTGSGAAIENRPPYLALCYIMYLG
jgi:microcystin-dependent protein